MVLPCFANLWLASFRSVKDGETKLAASCVNQKAASSTLSSLPRPEPNGGRVLNRIAAAIDRGFDALLALAPPL